jgi:hypothetical protein
MEVFTYSKSGRKIKFTEFYNEDSYGTLNYKPKQFCSICLRAFSSGHLKQHKKRITKLVGLLGDFKLDYGVALYILSFIGDIPMNPLPPQGVPPVVIDLVTDDVATTVVRKRRLLSDASVAYVNFKEEEAMTAQDEVWETILLGFFGDNVLEF